MAQNIQLGSHLVGKDHPPFIIAEMSGNHNQSLDRALEIVEKAHQSGAHALKLQCYTADTMTIDHNENEFSISDPKSLWKGESLYQLYQKAYTPWEWHEPIFKRCQELGMEFLSTPFDETAVDYLESLGVSFYKVASFENTDLPLIRKIASTKKPMIISTGMATVSELDETVNEARAFGCEDIILLKCTSTYPASAANTNIRTIPHMQELFDVVVGLSDHTLGTGVATASVALGARVIEKHFTLNRADGGVDSAFSIEPHELKELVNSSYQAFLSLGKVSYGPKGDEVKSLQFRRTLYVVEDMQQGEALSSKNLRAIRPGRGLAPKYFDILLGKKINKSVKRGTPLSWDLIE